MYYRDFPTGWMGYYEPKPTICLAPPPEKISKVIAVASPECCL